MGDPACWLPEVCATCGGIHDDPDERCPEPDTDDGVRLPTDGVPPRTDG